jgi:hypothetical protein
MNNHLPIDYKPGPLDQRPPVALATPVLEEMLQSAIGQAYVSGSVGTTWIQNEGDFEFKVSVEITRRKTNQCDGCLAGLPIEGNLHRNPNGSPNMACQKERY